MGGQRAGNHGRYFVVLLFGEERKKTKNPREGWEDGTPPPHRDFKERSVVLAVAHPWASASSYLFPYLSLFAVSRRFLLRPSCRLSVVPLSSFSPLSLMSLLPLSRRSPLPRSATPPPPAGPFFSRLLSPFGATPPSSQHILAPRVYRALLAQGRLF